MRKYILGIVAVWAVMLLIFAFVLGDFEFICNKSMVFGRLLYVVVSSFGTFFALILSHKTA